MPWLGLEGFGSDGWTIKQVKTERIRFEPSSIVGLWEYFECIQVTLLCLVGFRLTVDHCGGFSEI